MKLTLHTPDTIYSPRHFPSWLLLAGGAGTVNGVAFLVCEQFVTHVTGTITRAGLEWSQDGWSHVGLAAEYVAVLLCFVAGAAASVIAIQARVRRGKSPRWASPLVVVALTLVVVALAGQAGAFGQFGGRHAADPPPVVLLSMLAFAMGLQNSAVASATGQAVRTTHLSGPSTDLGVFLGSALVATGAERRASLWGAALRGGKVVAYMLGAGLALPLAGSLGFLALLVPASLVLAAAVLSFVPGFSLVPSWRPGGFPIPSGDGPARAANEPGAPAVGVR